MGKAIKLGPKTSQKKDSRKNLISHVKYRCIYLTEMNNHQKLQNSWVSCRIKK